MNGGRSLLVASCMLAALIAGCGDGSEEPAHTATAPAAAAPASTVSAREQQRAERRAALEERRRIEATFAPNPYPPPRMPPPRPNLRLTRVIVRDIKVGRGPAVRAGDTIDADWIWGWPSTGRIASFAWGRGRTDYIILPSAQVGLRRGLIGMRPGGRRTILIPTATANMHGPDGEGWEMAYADVVVRRIWPRDE